MKNIFLEKSCSKCRTGASPSPFYKNSKLNISLDQQPEILKSLVFLYNQFEVYQNKLKLRHQPLAFTLYKAFIINRRRAGTNLPASFFA